MRDERGNGLAQQSSAEVSRVYTSHGPHDEITIPCKIYRFYSPHSEEEPDRDGNTCRGHIVLGRFGGSYYFGHRNAPDGRGLLSASPDEINGESSVDYVWSRPERPRPVTRGIRPGVVRVGLYIAAMLERIAYRIHHGS